MLTFDEAYKKAQTQIAMSAQELNLELVITNDRVLESARGWMFPYNTKRFTETHYPSDGLVGNRPIFVDKNDGSVHIVSTAVFRRWLDEYDRTGAPPPPRIKFHVYSDQSNGDMNKSRLTEERI